MPRLLVLLIFGIVGLVGCTKARTLDELVASSQPLKLATNSSTLPSAQKGARYSFTYGANNGQEPLSYSIVSGTVPGGVELSSNGLLSGIITGNIGSYSFTVRVTDAQGQADDQTYSLDVGLPFSILSKALPNAFLHGSYTAVLTVSGGTAPYTYQATNLPTGLSVSASTGLVTGTPTTLQTNDVTFTVQDAVGLRASSVVPVSVVASATAPTITTSTLTNGVHGSVYAAIVPVSGGLSPWTYAVVSGALPGGLTINTSNGLVSGTPTAAGSYTFGIQVTDGVGATDTKAIALTIDAAAAPSISTTTLAAGQVAVAYMDVLFATGGSHPYTWSLTAGSLPAGIVMNSANGVLSGTPSATGTSSFTVRCTDSLGSSVTKALSIVIGASPYQTLSFANSTLLPMSLGQSNTRAILGAGGLPPYTYAVTTGALPSGLTLTGSTGLISGIPTATGTASFTVTLTDARSSTATQVYSLQVTNPIDVATVSLPTALSGAAYSTTILGTGGTAPYTFSATGLPVGLSINSSTGILSGTTTVVGSHAVTISIADTNGLTTQRGYTLVVVNALSISTSSVNRAAIQIAFSQTISVSGGLAPFTFSVITGSLPAGLSLSSSGDLTGTPSKGANAKSRDFSFTVQVSDSSGQTATRAFTMTTTIAPRPFSDTSQLLRPAVEGVAYSDWIKKSGGYGQVSYTATGLPAGLSMNSTSGRISGTPSAGAAAASPYTIAVRTTDAYGIATTVNKKLYVRATGLTAQFDGAIVSMATNNTNNTTFNAYDIQHADLNGDGRLDAIYLSQATRQFVVALQNGTGANGDGTFTTYFSAVLSGSPSKLRIADMDNDGKLDVITISNTTAVAVEIFKGNGVWTNPAAFTKQQITVAAELYQLDLADLNGDLALDLVVATRSSNVVRTYINCLGAATVSYAGVGNQACSTTGQTIFNYHIGGTPTPPGTNPFPTGVGLVDLNNDGKVDLIAANNNTRTITTFLGNGDGTFAAPLYTSPTLSFSPAYVAAEVEPLNGWTNTAIRASSSYFDMNGDGYRDFVVSASTVIYIFLGDGTGQISQIYTADVSSYGSSAYVKVADVNGDSKPDLVSEITNVGRNNIQVFLNNGTGQVSAPSLITDGFWGSFALGRFLPTSTRPDLLSIRTWNSTAIYNTLKLRKNSGSSSQPYNGGQFYFAFKSPTGVLYDFLMAAFAIGDINGDGYADLLGKTTGNAIVATGNASGTLTNQTWQVPNGELGSYTGWFGQQSILRDVDGDGVLDFANAHYNGAIYSSASVSLGNGDGTFGALNFINTDASGCISSLGATSIDFGDFDRDGREDLIVAQGCGGTPRIMIYFGYGDGTFNTTSPTIISGSGGSYVQAIKAEDIDNDGKTDLIGVTNSGSLFAYQGNGDGTFQSVASINYSPTSISSISNLYISDLNNDGYKDFTVSGYGATGFAVALGAAGGTAATASVYTGISALSYTTGTSLAVTDWDADGNLDIIWNKTYSGLQFFKGNGNGTFVNPTKVYSLPNPSAFSQNTLYLIDVNNDGLQDLATTDNDGNQATSIGISVNLSN